MSSSKLHGLNFAKTYDGSVKAELDRVLDLLCSVSTHASKPSILGQMKRRFPSLGFYWIRCKEYSLYNILHGILLVLINLDQKSTEFSFNELLYHINTFKMCSQALGLELIESAKRLEGFGKSSHDWTVDKAIKEFSPKLQVHRGPYYVCDQPIDGAAEAIHHLRKYVYDNVYMALGLEAKWNVENLKGVRPRDDKSLWYETYNLLDEEESDGRPFDEALPYKLACMGLTMSIYGSESRNWLLSLTRWMQLPCAMAMHSRLGRNSPMRCLNDDLLLLVLRFVIEI